MTSPSRRRAWRYVLLPLALVAATCSQRNEPTPTTVAPKPKPKPPVSSTTKKLPTSTLPKPTVSKPTTATTAPPPSSRPRPRARFTDASDGYYGVWVTVGGRYTLAHMGGNGTQPAGQGGGQSISQRFKSEGTSLESFELYVQDRGTNYAYLTSPLCPTVNSGGASVPPDAAGALWNCGPSAPLPKLGSGFAQAGQPGNAQTYCTAGDTGAIVPDSVFDPFSNGLNYSCGDGGIIRVRVYPNGAGDKPDMTGSPLGTTTFTPGLQSGCLLPNGQLASSGCGNNPFRQTGLIGRKLTFSPPVTLTNGAYYHLVFENISSNYETNFMGQDDLGNRVGSAAADASRILPAQDTDAMPQKDWGSLYKVNFPGNCRDTAGAWVENWPTSAAGPGIHSRNCESQNEWAAPNIVIKYGDGHFQGNGYVQALGTNNLRFYNSVTDAEVDTSFYTTGSNGVFFRQLMKPSVSIPAIDQIREYAGVNAAGTFRAKIQQCVHLDCVNGATPDTVGNGGLSTLANVTVAGSLIGGDTRGAGGTNYQSLRWTVSPTVTLSAGTQYALDIVADSGTLDVAMLIDGVANGYYEGGTFTDGRAQRCSVSSGVCTNMGGYDDRDIQFLFRTTAAGAPATTTTTTTTAAPTTTTTTPVTVPALSPTAVCSPGTRVQAEAWTPNGSTGLTGAGYVTHSGPNTSYLIPASPPLTGAASATFRVFNGSGAAATRNVYFAPSVTHTPFGTVTLNVPAGPGWVDASVSFGTLTGGTVYDVSPSLDVPGTTGTLSFDYVDLCGAAFATATTTTAATTTTTIPVDPSATYRSKVIGMPFKGDADSRVVVSAHGSVDFAVRSPYSGPQAWFKAFLQGDGGYGCGGSTPNVYTANSVSEDICYSFGNGGTIQLDVYADSGGQPTGSSLGSFTKTTPLVAGKFAAAPVAGGVCAGLGSSGSDNTVASSTGSYFGCLPLSPQPTLVAGRVYHYVFTNPASNASNGNWYAIDMHSTRQKPQAEGATVDVSVLPRTDVDLLLKRTGAGADTLHNTCPGAAPCVGTATWRSCTAQGDTIPVPASAWCWDPNTWLTPVFQLGMASGSKWGIGDFNYSPLGASMPIGTAVGTFGGNATRHRMTFSVGSGSPWANGTVVDRCWAQIIPQVAGTARCTLVRDNGTTNGSVMSSVDIPFTLSSAGLEPLCHYGAGPTGSIYDTPGNAYSLPSPPTCSNNGKAISGAFPSPQTLNTGSYWWEWEVPTGTGRFGIQASACSYWPENCHAGTYARSINRAAWVAEPNGFKMFSYLGIADPSGTPTTTTTPGATTSTTAPATTTTAAGSIPAVGSPPSVCAGGTRYEAESAAQITVNGTVTAGSGYRLFSNASTSINLTTPLMSAAGNYTVNVRYFAANPAGRTVYVTPGVVGSSGSYSVNAEGFPATSGAWAVDTETYNVTGVGSQIISWSWDPGPDFGTIAVDYVDVCPLAAGTTTTSTTTTTIAAGTCLPAGRYPLTIASASVGPTNGSPTANLTDGNLATVWSGTDPTNQTITLDLGQNRVLHTIAIKWVVGKAAGLFVVDTKADAVSGSTPWVRRLVRNLYSSAGTTSCVTAPMAGTHRYVRLTMARLEAGSSGPMQIGEISVS